MKKILKMTRIIKRKRKRTVMKKLKSLNTIELYMTPPKSGRMKTWTSTTISELFIIKSAIYRPCFTFNQSCNPVIFVKN